MAGAIDASGEFNCRLNEEEKVRSHGPPTLDPPTLLHSSPKVTNSVSVSEQEIPKVSTESAQDEEDPTANIEAIPLGMERNNSGSNSLSDWDLRENSEIEEDSETEEEILYHLKKVNANPITELRDCILNPVDINVTFSDVHITPDARDALDPLFFQLYFPDQFRTGVLAQNPSTGLLLYGPPGTGKTQFVKAFAQRANATVLSVTGADFQSHHVGESEKKIQKIFACARAHEGPFVIFIDEADSVFRTRGKENSSQHHTNDVNQFLLEMDGVRSSGLLHVMVIAASNRPFDIDEGILRRLGRRILVDVPTKRDREMILEIHLRGEDVAEDVDICELARRTSDYTGADLKNLVYEAALAAVRDIALQARRTRDYGTQTRVICKKHFIHALSQIQPAPKTETVEKIRKFHNRFGNTSQRQAEKSTISRKRKRPENENHVAG
ncbi:Spastin [Dactylella cylindrospora]|nr:Spastin [Dactylella cylindrospora]